MLRLNPGRLQWYCQSDALTLRSYPPLSKISSIIKQPSSRRASNQEAEVGECGSGSGAAACQTGLQSATADAETSRPTPVAVWPATRKQQTSQQQGQRVQQGLRWRPRSWRRARRPRPRTRKELAPFRESNKRECTRELLCFIFSRSLKTIWKTW
jgi:hypothetical protein